MKFQTINCWTKAKMIEHVKANFKGKSVADPYTGTCMYRGPDGKKCAVGLFITDKHYNVELEGKVASLDLFKSIPLLPLEYGLQSFQLFHDNRLTENDPVELQTEQLVRWIENNVEG